MISARRLRELRNDIPIERVIVDVVELPAKRSEGYLRFLCPLCGEFNSATQASTNLARCFRCARSFNPIDLVMAAERCGFLEAVARLEAHFRVGI